MSDRVVALVEELPPEQARILRNALPDGCELISGGSDLTSADYLVVRDGEAGAAAVDAAGRLRRVIRIAMGSGSVDEAACARRGIPVDVVESQSVLSVAEHAVMVMLALFKRLPEATERLRAGVVAGDVEPALTTQESYAFDWVGLESWQALYGKTVGLVGVGRIGSHAAALLRAFGCDLVYTKRSRFTPDEEAARGIRWAGLDELLRRSDCVSLHNRFTPETDKLMGEREFALMPRGSFFVNTARGRLVDEDALVAALESGHLGGAALDVFQLEPLPPDTPLLRAPNLILTPHTGGIPLAESQALELREVARLIASDAG